MSKNASAASARSHLQAAARGHASAAKLAVSPLDETKLERPCGGQCRIALRDGIEVPIDRLAVCKALAVKFAKSSGMEGSLLDVQPAPYADSASVTRSR